MATERLTRAARLLPAKAVRLAVLGALTLQAACASAPAPAVPGGAAPNVRAPSDGGRDLLEERCTGCHDLGGLSAYQGYYDEARWRGLVETMIAHGAELDETETNELVRYLVEHFGPGTRGETSRNEEGTR